MRRLLEKSMAAALSLGLALSLAACGGGGAASGGDAAGDESAAATEAAATEAAEPEDAVAPAAPTIEEQEIYNDNGITLSCTGADLIEEGYYRLFFKVANADAGYCEVVIQGISFNGIYLACDPVLMYVDSGETSDTDIWVPESVVKLAGIKSIDSAGALLSIQDDEHKMDVHSVPLDIKVASASGDNSYSITASDDVIFDEEGIKISYQDCEVNGDGEFKAYFLMENAADRAFRIVSVGSETAVDGSAGKASGMVLQSASIPAGASGLVDLHYFDYDSHSSDFETIDAKAQLEPIDSFDGIQFGLHLTRSGDSLTVKADEAVYPDGWEKGSSEKADETPKTSTESESIREERDGSDLVVENEGFTSQEVNGHYGTHAFCTASNPDDKAWVILAKVEWTLYDEKGNELITRENTMDYAIKPGGAVPFVSSSIMTDAPVGSASAKILSAWYLDEQALAERPGTMLPNDDVKMVDMAIKQGGTHEISQFLEDKARLIGKLENSGEAKDKALLTLLLYDAEDKVVYAEHITVSNIPAKGSVDIDEELDVTLLPDYDGATLDIQTK